MIKNVLYLTIIAVSLSVVSPAYSANTAPVDPAVCAQAHSDFDDKDQMLTAKYELWTYGSTRAMVIHSDGSYIGENKPVS